MFREDAEQSRPRRPSEEPFDGPVFAGVIRNDGEATVGCEQSERSLEAQRETLGLAIHRDAQRLEHARRAVNPAVTGGGRECVYHLRGKFRRRPERPVPPRLHDRARDAPRLPLVPVRLEELGEFLRCETRHDVCGRV